MQAEITADRTNCQDQETFLIEVIEDDDEFLLALNKNNVC